MDLGLGCFSAFPKGNTLKGLGGVWDVEFISCVVFKGV